MRRKRRGDGMLNGEKRKVTKTKTSSHRGTERRTETESRYKDRTRRLIERQKDARRD